MGNVHVLREHPRRGEQVAFEFRVWFQVAVRFVLRRPFGEAPYLSLLLGARRREGLRPFAPLVDDMSSSSALRVSPHAREKTSRLTNGRLIVLKVAQEILDFAPRGIDKCLVGTMFVLRILLQETPVANANNNEPEHRCG